MSRRAFAVFAIMLVASSAGAARWSVSVAAPRPDLPSVEIVAGYDGMYIPPRNPPIELHARTGTRPFDGYIGFAYVVGESYSNDTPVAARAEIAANHDWSFSTIAPLLNASDGTGAHVRRELVIEWRNRLFRVIAKHNVGRPPWSDLRPLRIAGATEGPGAAPANGPPPYVVAASALPANAQWYEGFSVVAVAVNVWLDLPTAIREAIMHSGTRVNFFGTPRPEQKIDRVDEAVLPVRFESGSGLVAIPPLFQHGSATLAAPVSWRAMADAEAIGDALRPYMVAGPRSAYVAEEAALGVGVRAMGVLADTAYPSIPTGRADVARAIVRRSKPLLLLLASVVIGSLLWIRLRRTGDLRVVVVIALGAAAAMLYGRRAIRPTEGFRIDEEWFPLGTRATVHRWIERSWGTSPVATPRLTAEDLASSTASAMRSPASLEVRTPGVLPGYGTLRVTTPWNAVARIRERVETAGIAQMRVTAMNDREITFDYNVPIAANEALVRWTHNGHFHVGATRLDGASGHATARSGVFSPKWWDVFSAHERLTFWTGAESVEITFAASDAARDRYVSWEGSGLPRKQFQNWRMQARLTMRGEHAECVYRLPAEPIPPGGRVSVGLSTSSPVSDLELTGDTGTVTVKRAPTLHLGEQYFIASADDVARIIGPTRLLRLRIKPGNTTPPEIQGFATLYMRKTDS